MTFLTLKVTTNKQNEERKAAQHRTEEQDAFSHFSKTFLDFPCPTKVGRTDYKNNNTKSVKIVSQKSIGGPQFLVYIFKCLYSLHSTFTGESLLSFLT